MLLNNYRKFIKTLFISTILCFGFLFLFINNQRAHTADEEIQSPSLPFANQNVIINNSIPVGIPDSVVFNDIYKRKLWGIGSGLGSQKSTTVEYRELLQRIFDDERYNSFVDFGCGDFQIMELMKVPTHKSYIGIDAVADVIKKNQELFGSQHSNYQFHHIEDISVLKRGSELLKGDMIIAKDVLQHLPNRNIQYFIDQILPNFKYALITNDYTDDVIRRNSDIAKGQARPVDLTYPPFNLKNMEAVLHYTGTSFLYFKRVYLYTNPDL